MEDSLPDVVLLFFLMPNFSVFEALYEECLGVRCVPAVVLRRFDKF
jgi:hypothetical protein